MTETDMPKAQAAPAASKSATAETDTTQATSAVATNGPAESGLASSAVFKGTGKSQFARDRKTQVWVGDGSRTKEPDLVKFSEKLTNENLQRLLQTRKLPGVKGPLTLEGQYIILENPGYCMCALLVSPVYFCLMLFVVSSAAVYLASPVVSSVSAGVLNPGAQIILWARGTFS